jgi:hypothetical protein
MKKIKKESKKERKKYCRHTETPIMIPLIPSKRYGRKESNHTKKDHQR